MDIPVIDTPLVPGTTPQQPGGSSELGQDSFLNLLTTQMQHQDPLNPMANEDFIAQLAQFASLEQLVGIGTNLEAVYLGVASMNNTSMTALLGNEVVAYGDGIVVEEGDTSATLEFEAMGPFESGTLSIYDEDGQVVQSIEIGSTPAGEASGSWDLDTIEGPDVEPGSYTFSITAENLAGDSVDVLTMVTGTVTEMDYSSGTPEPSVDGVVIGLDDIIRLTSGEAS